ncbi:MAG: hypothetical protein WC378_16190 [Opitutaceae bacterium]|jgi:hypothetical protein
MTPWKKEKTIIDAAEWMWQNQEKNIGNIWWTPADLTQKNVDTSNPNLSTDDAEMVFDALKKRGLIRPDEITVAITAVR